MLFFIVAFRAAKEWEDATFAERKATLICCTMLNDRDNGPNLPFASFQSAARLKSRKPSKYKLSNVNLGLSETVYLTGYSNSVTIGRDFRQISDAFR